MKKGFDFEEYMFQNPEPNTQALLQCLLGKNGTIPYEFGTIWQQMLPETRGFHPNIPGENVRMTSSWSNLSLPSEQAGAGKIREGP